MAMCSRDCEQALEHTKYYSSHFSQAAHLKLGKHIHVRQGHTILFSSSILEELV